MKEKSCVSLVIPVFNEGLSIQGLISTIHEQSFQPEEVILVDGGSTDNTVQVIKEITAGDPRYRIIEIGRAMPGKGRNEGARNANCEWIAFTDAGIWLEQDWLNHLVMKSEREPRAAIIYGNYSPEINSFFDKCAAITYVPPMIPGKIRGKFIASSMIKKEVWEKTGGFPDWRAAEDLSFMEKAEKAGYMSVDASYALVHWQLRQGIISTFKRFDLYSKWNVWAGKQAAWHYGVARQYAFMMIPLLLAIFHSWFWILLILAWILARVAKRIWIHRYEFGITILFNPAVFFVVMLLTLVIDTATFSGWIKAIMNKNKIPGTGDN